MVGALGAALICLGANVSCAQNQAQPPMQTQISKASWKFDFGRGASDKIITRVTPATIYSAQTGYGFNEGALKMAQGESISSDKPFLFSVAVPEGNYNVKVTLGSANAASDTTVKAEQRRLMLQNVKTAPGQFVTRTFTVNVHTPAIRGNERSVGLKPGEKGPPLAANWDDKLTLEFNGTNPSVTALEITPKPDALNVFVAGDSTVTDGRSEPFSAWGQMLPRFFAPGVAVSNYAESGLTLSSFKAQRRLDKIISEMKAGDYVLIQFGHNDQKEKGADKGPFKSYKTNLKEYVAAVRAKGGVPVVISPMERRRWKDGKPGQTLNEFAEAVRQVGTEEKVPVIDFNAMSLKLYAALGEEGSKKAFVFYPANSFPGQTENLADNTHFGNYGAYEMARLVVEGVRANVPELAKRLDKDVEPFDPSKPDSVEDYGVPFSVFGAAETPDGS